MASCIVAVISFCLAIWACCLAVCFRCNISSSVSNCSSGKKNCCSSSATSVDCMLICTDWLIFAVKLIPLRLGHSQLVLQSCKYFVESVWLLLSDWLGSSSACSVRIGDSSLVLL